MPSPTPLQLKTELTTDPGAIGYAASMANGNDTNLAALINSLSVGQGKGYTVEVSKVNASALQSAVVATEYASLTGERRDLWQALLTAGQGLVELKNTNIRSQINNVWAAGTTTRANILALQSRPCPRAEFLWGDGVTISVAEISAARLA